MAAEIVLFDDPLNPRGWVMEPARRRLALAFPDLQWTVRPVGMVESWDDYCGPEVEGGRAAMAAVCARLSERFGMPIDEYLWFDDAPTTSWPACRAIAAAGLQEGDEDGLVDGPVASCRLLRACREATFARQTSIGDEDRLREIADAVAGLDAEAFRAALEDGRAAGAFEDARATAADLDAPGVARTDGNGRCELPTLLVRADGDARGVSGVADFGEYLDAVVAVTGREPRERTADVETVLSRFSPEGWLARVELASLTGRSLEETGAEVAALVDSGEVVEETLAAEPFWRLAGYGEADAADAGDGGAGAA